MLNIHKFEGKTSSLNESIENIYYKVNEIEGKLFKSKKFEIEVITKKEIINFIKQYFKDLGKKMSIDINVEVRIVEDIVGVILVSSNNSILIGANGRMLNSIQLLLRQAISNQTNFNIKVNLDISNYKDKKMKRLEREVKKIANDVLKTKMDISLDPMNSYERRIIHNLINEYENLETESIGEGSERHIVIKYIEK